MTRFFLILLVWLMEVAVIILFLGEDMIESQIEKEQVYIQAYLGDETSRHLKESTDAWYRRAILDPGIERVVYNYFIPAKETGSGLEEMSPWLFTWMEGRLDAFWWAVYQFVFKMKLFGYWLPFIFPLLLAAMVDGWVTREKKKGEGGYSSPLRYDFSIYMVGILSFTPIIYFTTPMAIHPLWVPIWAGILCSIIILLGANTQQRI
jgi:hypothetical protein